MSIKEDEVLHLEEEPTQVPPVDEEDEDTVELVEDDVRVGPVDPDLAER